MPLFQDNTSLKGIDGEIETDIFQSESERAAVPTKDDGSQELFGTPCSCIPCYHTSKQAPLSVSASLTTYTIQRSTAASDPVMTQAVVSGIQKQSTLQLPMQASKRCETVTSVIQQKKAKRHMSVQDIHDLQFKVLQGKLLHQDKTNRKLDLQIELLQKLNNPQRQQLNLSQTFDAMFD